MSSSEAAADERAAWDLELAFRGQAITDALQESVYGVTRRWVEKAMLSRSEESLRGEITMAMKLRLIELFDGDRWTAEALFSSISVQTQLDQLGHLDISVKVDPDAL